MFTGIIERIGIVASIRSGKQTKSFQIRFIPWSDSLRTGESISVEGVCLTAKQVSRNSFSVDAVKATLQATTLGNLKVGSKVNLERSLKWGERMGGHYVSGHVDDVGKIIARKKEGKSETLKIKVPRAVWKFLVNKGSIAVDGISLTIQKLRSPSFEVAIIPYTNRRTTIGLKKAGDLVNLEADMMIKKFLQHSKGRARRPKYI